MKTVDIKGGGGEETTIVIAQERGVNGSLESEVSLRGPCAGGVVNILADPTPSCRESFGGF